MPGRTLVDVTDLLALGAGIPELESGLGHEMRDLADEFNSALDGYEVSLVHLDTADYLQFVRVDPTEGAYWQELEEERQEQAETIAALATEEQGGD